MNRGIAPGLRRPFRCPMRRKATVVAEGGDGDLRGRGVGDNVGEVAVAGTRRQIESIYADEDEGDSKKRAKSSGEIGLDFDNLPDALLEKITGYLPDKISCSLLAVALTAPESSWRRARWKIEPSTTARAVLANSFYGYVDFGEASVDLAAKLTDNDIGSVLACLGGTSPIERVHLTKCFNVRGYGLEPLRGSTHLEQLDLVGKKQERGVTYRENYMCEEQAIPILESIIDADGCALVDVHFPKKWRAEQSQQLRQLLSKFSGVLNDRKITCCEEKWSFDPFKIEACGKLCQETAERPWFSQSGAGFGTHNYACAHCCTSVCQDCLGGSGFPDKVCQRCDVKQCRECSETLECFHCKETTCHDCTMIKTCSSCDRASCNACDPVFWCGCCGEAKCTTCVPHDFCDYPGCEEGTCRDCGDYGSSVKVCFDCGDFCPGHLVQMRVRHGFDQFCSECNERATKKLSIYNEQFNEWIASLEKKYGGVGRVPPRFAARDDFPDALQVREQLRKRCNAVGDKLSQKQKQFERYDHWFKRYESPLDLENKKGGYSSNPDAFESYR